MVRLPATSRHLLAGGWLVLTTLLASVEALAAPDAVPWRIWDTRPAEAAPDISHAAWARFLSTYLVTDHPSGIHRVRYGAVTAADRQALQAYLAQMQARDPRRLARPAQMAYWVNLYNALTVELVLEHYPVESIRKIRPHFFAFGPWDMEVAEVAGEALTLNDIEHRILRPLFADPRIHFVINCASLGCPDLGPEPYVAARLDDQLEAATRAFLAHERGMAWHGGVLYLSSIFNWFEADFGSRDGVFRFLARHAPAHKRATLPAYDGRVRFDYGWQLNDAP